MLMQASKNEIDKREPEMMQENDRDGYSSRSYVEGNPTQAQGYI